MEKIDRCHPLYKRWTSMICRCYGKTDANYPNYGGRGIRVCDRWSNRLQPGRIGFANYVADMGLPPGPDYTIDRIDNDGDYSPENCRWATVSQQNANKRRPKLIALTDAQKRQYACKSEAMRSRRIRINNSLSDDQVRDIRRFLAAGGSCGDAAVEFRVSRDVIHKLKQGKTYQHVA
jgi:hypothetical protein